MSTPSVKPLATQEVWSVTQEVYPRGMEIGYTSWVAFHTSWSAHSKRYGAPKRYGPQGRSPRGMKCIPRGMAGATQEVCTCSPRHMTCNPRGMHPNRHLQEVWNALQEVCFRGVVKCLGCMSYLLGIPLGSHQIHTSWSAWVWPKRYDNDTQEVWITTQEVWQVLPKRYVHTSWVTGIPLGSHQIHTSWVT